MQSNLKNIKCWWPKNDERTTKDERQKTNDKRRATNERIDWFEFLSDWSEFRTIGPNPERMTSLTLLLVERADVVKFVKVSNAQKKFGVD